jgi:hypothetical protein
MGMTEQQNSAAQDNVVQDSVAQDRAAQEREEIATRVANFKATQKNSSASATNIS